MSGSGSAPQLDERRWTIFVCHGCGNGATEEREDLSCNWCGESRSMIEAVEVVPLAASPGAGELDLTDDQLRRIEVHHRYDCKALGTIAYNCNCDGREIRAKLRARLDRKDDDG